MLRNTLFLLLLLPASPAGAQTDQYAKTDSTYATVPRNKAGKIHGAVRVFYLRGKKEAVIPYVDGLKSGTERHYYRDGRLRSDTSWEKGRKYGRARWFYPSGKRAGEAVYNGDYLLDGRGYFESGELSEQRAPVLGGVLLTGFYRSGRKYSEVLLKDGLREGVEKTYFEDGRLRSETGYSAGKKEGVHREYDADGQLTVERWYEQDREAEQPRK